MRTVHLLCMWPVGMALVSMCLSGTRAGDKNLWQEGIKANDALERLTNLPHSKFSPIAQERRFLLDAESAEEENDGNDTLSRLYFDKTKEAKLVGSDPVI